MASSLHKSFTLHLGRKSSQYWILRGILYCGWKGREGRGRMLVWVSQSGERLLTSK